MKYFIFLICLAFSSSAVINANPLDSTLVISSEHMNEQGFVIFTDFEGWLYKPGDGKVDPIPTPDTEGWTTLRPTDLSLEHADANGKIEAWFHTKILLDSSLLYTSLSWRNSTKSALAIYLDGELVARFGNPHPDPKSHRSYASFAQFPTLANFKVGQVYDLTIYFVEHNALLIKKITNRKPKVAPVFFLVTPSYTQGLIQSQSHDINYLWLGVLILFTLLFWLLHLLNKGHLLFFEVSILSTLITIVCWASNFWQYNTPGIHIVYIVEFVVSVAAFMIVGLVPIIIDQLLKSQSSKRYLVLFWIMSALGIVSFFVFDSFNYIHIGIIIAVLAFSMFKVFKRVRSIQPVQWVMISGIILTILCLAVYVAVLGKGVSVNLMYLIISGIYLSMPISMLTYFTLQYNLTLNEVRNHAKQIITLSTEKERLIESQKSALEKEVQARTKALEKSLSDLKITQKQLIQQEKLASLGELTAGIAHEIQNPLNFVNNFSEVSVELLEEAREELDHIKTQYVESQFFASKNLEETEAILEDIKQNLEKITHHGKRADAIVKGMLLHSRSNSGEKEYTDINALADEYLRLSYHGLRAKDKSFNANFETKFDPELPKVKVIPQDVGRVLLNLINNAFQACAEFSRNAANKEDFKPSVTVSSKNLGDKIEVTVKDNGPGIPEHIKDKIFQPFFTTKPTGQGTGLGLSLSYDIMKSHGGEIKVASGPGGGTEFKLSFPLYGDAPHDEQKKKPNENK